MFKKDTKKTVVEQKTSSDHRKMQREAEKALDIKLSAEAFDKSYS